MKHIKDLPFSPQEINDYMKVVGYRLLVLPDPVEEVSEGGIITHVDYDGSGDMERAHVSEGTVVAIGPAAFQGISGYDFDKYGPFCKIGDHIKYTKYSGKFMFDPLIKDPKEKTGKLRYAYINDEDVQCVIDDKLIENLKKRLQDNG